MSSYAQEHNIQESSTSHPESPHEPHRNSILHPTLTQALDEFVRNNDRRDQLQNAQNRSEMERMVGSMMDYIVPGGDSDTVPDTSLFNQMLHSLLSSPDTMMVFGSDGDGKHGKKGGVDNEFMDTLDRVPVAKLPEGSRCPICTNDFRSSTNPLIVRLPCDSRHCFDLECISPWLKLNRTCPLCREDVTEVRKKKLDKLVKEAKEKEKEDGDEEPEDEDWMMYG